MILLWNSCKKENPPNEIPYVHVAISLDPNSTEYIELNAVNGWVTITGGYRGIIVFRSSTTEFKAYERACPFDWDQATARLNVDSSGITAYCPSCSSKFILLDGSPFSGPSTYPMKQTRQIMSVLFSIFLIKERYQ